MALPVVNSSKYTAVIPSTGVEVDYRPYLVKEEKILMIALESKDQKQIMKAVKDVIEACVFDDINVDELAVFDIETLFLKLRSKSVGETADLNAKCSKCEHPHEAQVNLEEIEVTGIDEDSKIIQVTDTIGVTMRYPTIGDFEAGTEGTEAILQLMTKCMVNIFDDDNVYPCKDETRKSLTDFIDSLNSGQFQKLAKFFQDLPALVHNIEFVCTKCEHENSIELKGIQSFFS